MSSIIRSPKAEGDLEEILTYLQQHSPSAADRFANKFALKEEGIYLLRVLHGKRDAASLIEEDGS